MNSILFSIITVTYNNSKGLVKTVESISQQIGELHEHIVIDGDSKDETKRYLKSLNKDYLNWISEPDKGIYDAMNKGLKLMKGKWVIFMNAGDTFSDKSTLKKFTEQNLKIENCSTETNLYIDKQKQKEVINRINQNKKNIILGVGSSGPTTRWGSKNFIGLIQKLDKEYDCFFFLLCGPNEKEIAQEIIEEIGMEKCSSLSNETISNIIPLISVCDIYIGNDSFGHHVASQCGIPSLIIMLDTPRAYSDYSINQHRIMPSEVNIDNITHDSRIDPNMIKVDQVYEKILSLLK